MSAADCLAVIGTAAMLRALTPISSPLPFAKLGVATYLKTHAGRPCSDDEVAAWVWPAMLPDTYRDIIKVKIHYLRREGAPIAIKRGGRTRACRQGSNVWEVRRGG